MGGGGGLGNRFPFSGVPLANVLKVFNGSTETTDERKCAEKIGGIGRNGRGE